jgi:hypothetical protein
MNQSENSLETQLEVWFSSFQAIKPRGQGAIQRGRRDFLAQASALSQPVSILDEKRHTGWIVSLISYFRTKEFSPMYTAIASIFLVLALMFGGSSAAVLAAQDSLPNQPLYQVKTFAEDLALRSTIRNAHRLQMELDYAGRRVSEMIRLREMHNGIPETVYLRLENHLDQALLVAANSEGGEMVRALNQVRERLQNHAGLLPSGLDHDPIMLRIREMIQTRIGWVELGLEDPLEFRQQAQVRTRFNQQARFEYQSGPGPGPDLDPEPGEAGFGPGPQDPGPKSDCQGESCDPAPENKYGPGPEAQENHHYGPGPENQPAGDSGHSPPDQPSSAAESPGPGPGSNQDQESGSDGQGSSSNSESSQGNGSNKGNGGTP